MNPHDPNERLARLIEAGLAAPVSRRELIRRGLALGLGLPAIGAALAACGLEPPAEQAVISPWRPPAPSPGPAGGLRDSFRPAAASPAPAAASPAPAALRAAVVGDYGMEGEPAAQVAALVAGWAPDLVLTTGDNNYPDGEAETIDRNIGQYYQQFIGAYRGAFGPGSPENRFFPTLGNHDWVVGFPEPYLAYFSLPGNGRYYSFERGPAAFFALDSMPGEPDGWTSDSAQAAWLREAMAASQAPWKIVLMHHPPHSSGHHGSSDWMQWPFAEWGARLVLAGHDHTYERILRGGVSYVVNGLGGAARYARGWRAVEGSQIFFNAEHGALLLTISAERLQLQFVTASGQIIDDVTI